MAFWIVETSKTTKFTTKMAESKMATETTWVVREVNKRVFV